MGPGERPFIATAALSSPAASDHADLGEQGWLRDAIEHYWRGGTRLVPTDWLEDIEIK